MRSRLFSSAFPLALAVLALSTFGLTLAAGGGARPAPHRAVPLAAEAPVTEAPAPTAASAPAATTAKALFAETCGMCHALRASGMRGVVGPDLDVARPTAARVRRAIRVGSLDGVMQPRLLRGGEARRVAAYVARVAGTR